MKVVLLEDVANLGNRLEVKDVSDGFALNFLIPNKKARFADEKTLAKIEDEKEKKEAAKIEREEKMKVELKKASGKSIRIKAKANEEGHLFAGISVEMIAKTLTKDLGVSVDSSDIEMSAPIKEVGEHEIFVKTGDDKVGVKVEVEAE